ncbi:MAG: YhfC family glutamic-type intramembrane protease [Myxococcota bacterium]
MLIAVHVLEVVLLLAGPLLLARALARRWSLPFGVFGIGLLTFVFGQVAQMGVAKVFQWAFLNEVLPAPSADTVPLIGAILGGATAALSDEPLRLWAFRRYLADQTNARSGALAGLGHGGAQAMLGGALTLMMATLAIVFRGQNFEDMQQMGFEGRSAIRLGMKVFAWWEESPLSVLRSFAQYVALVAMHIGLSVAVACSLRRRRLFAMAVLLHGLAATLIAYAVDRTFPAGWSLAIYGGAAVLSLTLGVYAARSVPTDRASE